MTANIVILLVNGLTLALALNLLILILWQDPRNEANFYFALFMFMMVMWASGSLLGRIAAYANTTSDAIQLGVRLLDVGFAGSSIAIYIYSAVIIGYRGRLLRLSALGALGIIILYQALLLALDAPQSFEITDDQVLSYSFNSPSVFVYFAFQFGTVLLVWRNLRKIRSNLLAGGILLFVAGQMAGILSARVRMLGGAEIVGAVAAFMMSYAVVRQQIMEPLLGRARQLEAVRDVSLAVTSRLRLEDTLATIAAQAAELLHADRAAIFLKRGDVVRLETVYNLPGELVGHELALGQGVAGTVALEQRGRRVARYWRDWNSHPDVPSAHEFFGAVACVPLLFADEVVGVLLVVHNRQGGLFNRDDMHLLELLGPQAAVAITNSRLFEAERKLSHDLTLAKDQLEVVLTSTENPVVAINKRFECIFINPAAMKLLEITEHPVGQSITTFVPPHFLPPRPLQAVRDLRRRDVHVYEITVGERAYLCHVAELGRRRLEGWVVVGNDVTQLKELDRLKSQMIRMTSHDLKNPLQAAMSYLELLIDDGDPVFSETMRGDADMVWTQLNRMYRMINGILDLERAESGTPVWETCVLEEVLGRVIVDIADQARNKGVTLHLDIKEELPPVTGDIHELTQAFANLIENAVKFTPPGGDVVVRAASNVRQILIDVADTGVGIPEDEQTKVFDRFFRGREGMARSDGSGLGLSLVKAIIERHKGEISLDSEKGKGTTMHICLPLTADVPAELTNRGDR